MRYTLQLIEEKVKQQQVTALHLISALAFIGAGAIIFKYNDTIAVWGLALLVIALALLGATIGMNRWLTTPTNNKIFRTFELVISGTLLAYSAVQQWKVPIGLFGVLSLALLFSLFWERKSNSALYITVDDEGLLLPAGIRTRALTWTGIENVLLRFSVLSVNTTDNHSYQWNVHKPEFDAGAFEQFCANNIDASRDKRNKRDW